MSSKIWGLHSTKWNCSMMQKLFFFGSEAKIKYFDILEKIYVASHFYRKQWIKRRWIKWRWSFLKQMQRQLCSTNRRGFFWITKKKNRTNNLIEIRLMKFWLCWEKSEINKFCMTESLSKRFSNGFTLLDFFRKNGNGTGKIVFLLGGCYCNYEWRCFV